jgi:hypothetical protein
MCMLGLIPAKNTAVPSLYKFHRLVFVTTENYSLQDTNWMFVVKFRLIVAVRWLKESRAIYAKGDVNPLNTELNPICHLLVLLGAHHIFHVSGLRVKSIRNLTLRGPCIVIYSYNKTNEMHWFLNFIFGIELYMFRTDPLSIIRSPVPYTQLYVCVIIKYHKWLNC